MISISEQHSLKFHECQDDYTKTVASASTQATASSEKNVGIDKERD